MGTLRSEDKPITEINQQIDDSELNEEFDKLLKVAAYEFDLIYWGRKRIE